LPDGRGLGVAPAADAWNALIGFTAHTVTPTVQLMPFFNDLDPLVEGY
jgi:hypothetical protein